MDKVLKKSIWLTVFISVFIWSGIGPKDYILWFLQMIPVFVGFSVLIITYNKFPLTPLLYYLILLYSVIIMIGSHYSYTEVPLFESIKPFFGFERNNYDKVGHIFQGFVPAMIAREIFIRKSIITSSKWMNFIIICICLSFSALYELIESIVAVFSGKPAAVSLGTQGFSWDTQTDMAFALFGAILALVLLGKFHDKQLSRLANKQV
jgi:putative membrane protein